MQTEPVAELEPHNSDTSVGLARGKLKSSLLSPAAVDGLVLGGSVQYAEVQPMQKYLLQLGSAAHLEVHSWQRCLRAGC